MKKVISPMPVVCTTALEKIGRLMKDGFYAFSKGKIELPSANRWIGAYFLTATMFQIKHLLAAV
ncbi:MAG: hypothetical protein RL115_1681 [Bacteroidota bacterium]|jgi:hypothetical protein